VEHQPRDGQFLGIIRQDQKLLSKSGAPLANGSKPNGGLYDQIQLRLDFNEQNGLRIYIILLTSLKWYYPYTHRDGLQVLQQIIPNQPGNVLVQIDGIYLKGKHILFPFF